jgi:hypothetical protein
VVASIPTRPILEARVTTVYVNDRRSDDERRAAVFAGDLFVYTPRATTEALVDLARELLEPAFAPHHPVEAQYELPVEKYAEIYAAVKQSFIHHPLAPRLIRDLLDDFGCDTHRVHQDLPRMRVNTAKGYLTSGAAYTLHPHRDTWYSAPMAQINWWLPIYPFESMSSMAFHTRHFDVGVENDSNLFNYFEWNAVGRAEAAKHVTSDTRWQPRARGEAALEPDVRVVFEPGGMLVFSGEHLHSTVPNHTDRARFSVDFRTVHLDDIESGSGAPNADTRATGTNLADFHRSSDGAEMPEEHVVRYGGEVPEGGVRIFSPPTSS